MIYKIILIDDEENSLILSEIMLNKYCPNFKVVGKAKTIDTAIDLIEEHEADCVLLDINMTNESGFDLLTKFPPYNYEVIFLTAYAEYDYVLKAFRATAVDYLLKPLEAQALKQAMHKVKERRLKKDSYEQYKELYKFMEQNMLSQDNTSIKKISYAVHNGYRFIDVSNILFIEANGEYAILHTVDGQKIWLDKNLGAYVSKLMNNTNFFKTHRSYLINLDFVESVIHIERRSVIMAGGEEVPIAKINKKQLLERLNV